MHCKTVPCGCFSQDPRIMMMAQDNTKASGRIVEFSPTFPICLNSQFIFLFFFFCLAFQFNYISQKSISLFPKSPRSFRQIDAWCMSDCPSQCTKWSHQPFLASKILLSIPKDLAISTAFNYIVWRVTGNLLQTQ